MSSHSSVGEHVSRSTMAASTNDVGGCSCMGTVPRVTVADATIGATRERRLASLVSRHIDVGGCSCMSTVPRVSFVDATIGAIRERKLASLVSRHVDVTGLLIYTCYNMRQLLNGGSHKVS